jgi:prepilin-type N-terminal cleavage/methylation domain-containing protein
MKKRKGFTLFELVIVILIILILAAIAIPNYLNLKDRAKRARAYEDLSNIGYLLEMYRVDWGVYPIVVAGETFGKNTDGPWLKSTLSIELTGSGAAAPYINIPGKKTLTGHSGGVEYIERTKFVNLYNPFNPSEDYHYQTDAQGKEWLLYLTLPGGSVLYRTTTITDLIEAAAPPVL